MIDERTSQYHLNILR